jgi:predicted nucleotidyltransferase
MPEIVEKIKTDLKKSLDKIYADKLKRLILFGSYARGDARSDSDMDFLVVLDIKDSELNVYDEISRMNDDVYDLVLEHEVTISVVPVSEEKYQYSIMPFIVNARNEGIAA